MKVDCPSFIHFVYPFLFEADTFAARTAAVHAAQWPQLGTIWQPGRFPTGELLRHVGDYLNPLEGAPATAQGWDLGDKALQSAPHGLGSGAGTTQTQWRLALGGQHVDFRIEARV